MKTVTLDWKGWWLLKQPMTEAPEMALKASIYAIVGAKLEKAPTGIACSKREIVVIGAHRGESLREFLVNLQKSAMGHFIRTRAGEIKKHPIVYVAKFDEAADFAEQAGVVSLIYDNMPFAPRHFAMPAKYEGVPLKIVNCGRTFGLKPEYLFGGSDDGLGEKRHQDSNATHNPDADAAMATAIAAEVQATRKVTREEMDVRGIATEKVAKPPGMIETEKVGKPVSLLETERIDKPRELSDRLKKVENGNGSSETSHGDTSISGTSTATEIDVPRR